MISWQYFPKSDEAPQHLVDLVQVFTNNKDNISSLKFKLKSNEVLAVLRQDLEKIGYRVERGKKKNEKILVPVLFGRNGFAEKSFEADALHEATGTVLEVEAGRAVLNFQFLKDLFQACMMHNVKYLAISIRIKYGSSKDFETVCTYFDTLYASGRISLPLTGILVVGY